MAKKKKFHCKSDAQKKAIAVNYARNAEKNKSNHVPAPYPHFRYYKKSGHPALIVGEQKGEKFDKNGTLRDTEEYRYRKVTHSEYDGRHLNEKVYPNPNKKDKRPMYIVKRVRADEKNNFSVWIYPWKYKKK